MKIPITLAAAAIAGLAGFGWTMATYRPAPEPVPGWASAGMTDSPNRWSGETGGRPPRMTAAELRSLLEREPDNAETWFRLGRVLSREGDSGGAYGCWVQAAELKGLATGADSSGMDLYDLCRYRALAGDREGALAAWEGCIAAGWADGERAGRSRDLETIRDDPRFLEGLEKIAPGRRGGGDERGVGRSK